MTEIEPYGEEKAAARCPCCKTAIDHVINEKHISGKPKIVKLVRPWKNPDGSRNWANMFYMDPAVLILLIAIVLLMFGFIQVQDQCNALLEHPCDFVEQYDCREQGPLGVQIKEVKLGLEDGFGAPAEE